MERRVATKLGFYPDRPEHINKFRIFSDRLGGKKASTNSRSSPCVEPLLENVAVQVAE